MGFVLSSSGGAIVIVGSWPASDSAVAIASRVMPPGLKRRAFWPVQSIIVDSSPLSHGPPSSTNPHLHRGRGSHDRRYWG